MNPAQSSSPSQFSRLIIVAAVLLLIFVKFNSRQTASSQDPQPSSQEPQREMEFVPPEQEKKFHIGARSDIPLKFKVKNLNSKRWAHDLEIEVENTAERPIYFFDFFMLLPGIKGLGGNDYGFWMHYGRGKLVDFFDSLGKRGHPTITGRKTYLQTH